MESTRGGSSSLDKGFTFSWTEIASATSAAELGEGEAALEDSCTGTFVQHEPMSFGESLRSAEARSRYEDRVHVHSTGYRYCTRYREPVKRHRGIGTYCEVIV